MKKSSLYFFSLFLSGLLGCTDNGTLPSQEMPTGNDPRYDGLIPMALGNYWVFVDSLNSQSDTSQVVGYENSSDFLWWKLNRSTYAMSDFTDDFAIRNDTVFVKEPIRGGAEIVAYVIVPPTDTTTGYFYASGGDSWLYRQVTFFHDGYTVPAGTFQDYACYVQDIGLGRDSLVIAPGVGVVCRVTEWLSFPGPKYNRVTHYLQSFHKNSN